MLSACRVLHADPADSVDVFTPEQSNASYLYVNMDVSSNSYGLTPCNALAASHRALQLQGCPFNFTASGLPCAALSTCANVDWSNPSLSTTCEHEISIYCQILFENDVQACTSFLNYYVKCEFYSQPVQELQAMIKGIMKGINGKGIVYVYAAGNEYGVGTDVSFNGTHNS